MDLTEAFTEALTDTTTPPPTTGADLVGYAGGPPALARLDTGLPPTGPLPRRDTDPDGRRRYENAKRRSSAGPPPKADNAPDTPRPPKSTTSDAG